MAHSGEDTDRLLTVYEISQSRQYYPQADVVGQRVVHIDSVSLAVLQLHDDVLLFWQWYLQLCVNTLRYLRARCIFPLVVCASLQIASVWRLARPFWSVTLPISRLVPSTAQR